MFRKWACLLRYIHRHLPRGGVACGCLWGGPRDCPGGPRGGPRDCPGGHVIAPGGAHVIAPGGPPRDCPGPLWLPWAPCDFSAPPRGPLPWLPRAPPPWLPPGAPTWLPWDHDCPSGNSLKLNLICQSLLIFGKKKRQFTESIYLNTSTYFENIGNL